MKKEFLTWFDNITGARKREQHYIESIMHSTWYNNDWCGDVNDFIKKVNKVIEYNGKSRNT